MKTFNEFLATLSAEKLSEVAANAAATSQGDGFAKTTKASTAVTLELLRLYHEWLSQQLP